LKRKQHGKMFNSRAPNRQIKLHSNALKQPSIIKKTPERLERAARPTNAAVTNHLFDGFISVSKNIHA